MYGWPVVNSQRSKRPPVEEICVSSGDESEMPLGLYRVTHVATWTAGRRRMDRRLDDLHPGTLVEVLEIIDDFQDQRVRGRVRCRGIDTGWISLRSIDRNLVWVQRIGKKALEKAQKDFVSQENKYQAEAEAEANEDDAVAEGDSAVAPLPNDEAGIEEVSVVVQEEEETAEEPTAEEPAAEELEPLAAPSQAAGPLGADGVVQAVPFVDDWVPDDWDDEVELSVEAAAVAEPPEETVAEAQADSGYVSWDEESEEFIEYVPEDLSLLATEP